MDGTRQLPIEAFFTWYSTRLPPACPTCFVKFCFFFLDGQPPPAAVPDAPVDPKGWKLGGLPDDESSDNFRRKNMHPGGHRFSLAADLQARLPQLNRAGLSTARDFVGGGKDKSLPFVFFQETFPVQARDIILEEVRVLRSIVLKAPAKGGILLCCVGGHEVHLIPVEDLTDGVE